MKTMRVFWCLYFLGCGRPLRLCCWRVSWQLRCRLFGMFFIKKWVTAIAMSLRVSAMALLTLVIQIDLGSTCSGNFPAQIFGLTNTSNCVNPGQACIEKRTSPRNQSMFASHQRLLLLTIFFIFENCDQLCGSARKQGWCAKPRVSHITFTSGVFFLSLSLLRRGKRLSDLQSKCVWEMIVQ